MLFDATMGVRTKPHRPLRACRFTVFLFFSSQGNMDRINTWATSLKDILRQMNNQMQVL